MRSPATSRQYSMTYHNDISTVTHTACTWDHPEVSASCYNSLFYLTSPCTWKKTYSHMSLCQPHLYSITAAKENTLISMEIRLKLMFSSNPRQIELLYKRISKCSSFPNQVHDILKLNRLVTKPTKWHVCPAKTQTSLGIRPVWSESSLLAWRKLGSLATH